MKCLTKRDLGKAKTVEHCEQSQIPRDNIQRTKEGYMRLLIVWIDGRMRSSDCGPSRMQRGSFLLMVQGNFSKPFVIYDLPLRRRGKVRPSEWKATCAYC